MKIENLTKATELCKKVECLKNVINSLKHAKYKPLICSFHYGGDYRVDLPYCMDKIIDYMLTTYELELTNDLETLKTL